VLGFAPVEAYYVIGSVLAVWALLVSGLGVMRKGFPGSRTGEIAVGAVTAALMLGTISAAVIGATANQDEGEDPDHGAVPTLNA
jgi:F0F1-type ATP synthase membrane subunit c/vacuolar-type H+-ATPase subunit K